MITRRNFMMAAGTMALAAGWLRSARGAEEGEAPFRTVLRLLLVRQSKPHQ